MGVYVGAAYLVGRIFLRGVDRKSLMGDPLWPHHLYGLLVNEESLMGDTTVAAAPKQPDKSPVVYSVRRDILETTWRFGSFGLNYGYADREFAPYLLH